MKGVPAPGRPRKKVVEVEPASNSPAVMVLHLPSVQITNELRHAPRLMLRRHASFGHATSVLRAIDTRAPLTPPRRWLATGTTTPGGDDPAKAKIRRTPKPAESTATVAEEPSKPSPQKRPRGRPRKTPPSDTPSSKPSNPRRTSPNTKTTIPPRLLALASPHHNNLPTFLAHTRAKNLSPTSAVYRGTHYEYTCAQALSAREYSFILHRAGRAGDLGVDLVGWWKLPCDQEGEDDGRRRRWREVKVLAQCKLARRPQPAMVRELEGAYAGAPAGWDDGDGVLALLLTTGPATKGVVAALRRSRLPMGVLQVSVEGEVKGFLWNAVAASQAGLRDMGVVVRYAGRGEEREAGVAQSVRLTWKGRLWRAASK